MSTAAEIMQMIRPIEMALPSHPQILSQLRRGAPQTSKTDVGATRDLFGRIAGHPKVRIAELLPDQLEKAPAPIVNVRCVR